MSDGTGGVAEQSLALLMRMDTKMDKALARLSVLERRGAIKDEESILDRISIVELRQRVERIERRLEITG